MSHVLLWQKVTPKVSSWAGSVILTLRHRGYIPRMWHPGSPGCRITAGRPRAITPLLSRHWVVFVLGATLTCRDAKRGDVREFNTLKFEVFGRARLPPSRDLVKKPRLTRRFALPISGHPVPQGKQCEHLGNGTASTKQWHTFCPKNRFQFPDCL
jgi:hypothetical protein